MATVTGEQREALVLRRQAEKMIVIRDAETHTAAKEFIKGAKILQRKIVDHWQRILRSDDENKRNHLNQKHEDLEPVEQAIVIVSTPCLAYEEKTRKREQEEREKARREAEEKARVDREHELARLETEAVKAEEGSSELSKRERVFIEQVTLSGMSATKAAEVAGFTDPLKTAARLMSLDKIINALAARRQADALRQQAAARKDEPLKIQVKKTASRLGASSGTRTVTTYRCEILDLEKLQEALLARQIPIESFEPDMTELNDAAGRLKDSFEQAYPGCRLLTNKSIAG